MTSPLTDNHWDAAVQEKRWRSSTESVRQALDQLGQKLAASSPDFYVLCLAELDAVGGFNWSECFSSRAVFLSELRRLIAKPSTPSRPVPNVQAYRDSQKWWLESVVKQYEQDT